MASVMATKRLRKEYLAMQRKPVDYIQAVPVESNILEWHYVITGTKGSPYEGGFYHGKLKFPPEYPMKPPSVMMITPNGRFKTNQRLCLSMSDFHPETWNPMWSVSSILTGLYSFMLENQATLGSISTTDAQKRKYAAASLETNCSNATFRKLFPDLVALQEEREKDQELLRQLSPAGEGAASAPSSAKGAASENGGAIEDWSTTVYLIGSVLMVATFAAYWLS
ncbi:Ubiquitin-conjugating enzyme E2 [Phytophthora cinnamomi]|uniref:Ubiquitin-conjugating enzyme E2 n=1 Tax=Phytophthora cinnamomi TaxID=4785 RepID=UPI00355A28AE|nr:Ubiquitin-conjugating enzyme E2 [Phytophthora cinnamomi]